MDDDVEESEETAQVVATEDSGTAPDADVADVPEAEAEPEESEPAEPAEPEPVPAPVAEDVAELKERLRAAERRADELASVSRRQSEMADELHKENRRLRDGELREAISPLIRGLARVTDDIFRIRASRPDDEDLAHIDTRVREVLHDAGATTVRPDVGDPFDPRVHQAAGSTPTTEPERDRTVAEVRRDGLIIDGGRMLRPADVIVFRLQAAPVPDPANPTANGD